MTHTKKHCWNCHGLGQWYPNSRQYKEPCHVCAGTGSAEVAQLRDRIMELDAEIESGKFSATTVEEFAAAMNEWRSLTHTGDAA